MASVLTLKTDIRKLKAAIASKATSGAIKTKLRGKLTNLENQLDKLQPNKRKPKTTGPKNESALVRLAKKRRTNQGLSTSKSDIERDAIRPAKKAGRRISANGNRYYEYRDNRVDNRQPPKKYRKLADGGGTSDGWYEDFNDAFEKLVTKKYITQEEFEKYQQILNQVDPIDKYGKMSGRTAAKKFVDDNKRYIKMADGGVVDKDYKDKLVKNILKKSLSKNINGFKLVKGTFGMEGSLHWRNKQYDDIEVYATPFFTPDDEINFENYYKDTLLRKEDKDYKLTHDLDKDTETYFNYLEKKLTESGVLPEWAVTIESEDGEQYDWVGFAKSEDDALYKAEQEAGFESAMTGMQMLTYDGEQDIYKQGGYMAKGGDLTLIKKKYEENEDENAHSENVVLLAKHFGTKADLAKAKEILDLHEKEGYLSSENGKKRTELHYKLIDKARAEMGKQGIKFEKGGYMADGGNLNVPYVVYDEEEMKVLKEFKNFTSAKKFANDYLDKHENKIGSVTSMPKSYYEKNKMLYPTKEYGGYMADGGKTKDKEVVRGYFEDEAYEYGKGGEIKSLQTELQNKVKDCEDIVDKLALYYKGDTKSMEALTDALQMLGRASRKAIIYTRSEDLKEMADGGMMADGGSVSEGNYQMLLSQAKEVMHHAKELISVAKPNMDIEAWVVAKAERATTDLSDITHYLDGLKMAMGGMVKHNEHKVNA